MPNIKKWPFWAERKEGLDQKIGKNWDSTAPASSQFSGPPKMGDQMRSDVTSEAEVPTFSFSLFFCLLLDQSFPKFAWLLFFNEDGHRG